MRDPFGSEGSERGGRWRQRLLDIDGWIDSSLHDAGHGTVAAYDRIVSIMGRMRLEGVSRGFA